MTLQEEKRAAPRPREKIQYALCHKACVEIWMNLISTAALLQSERGPRHPQKQRCQRVRSRPPIVWMVRCIASAWATQTGRGTTVVRVSARVLGWTGPASLKPAASDGEHGVRVDARKQWCHTFGGLCCISIVKGAAVCTWKQPKHCRGMQRLTRLACVTRATRMTAKVKIERPR